MGILTKSPLARHALFARPKHLCTRAGHPAAWFSRAPTPTTPVPFAFPRPHMYKGRAGRGSRGQCLRTFFLVLAVKVRDHLVAANMANCSTVGAMSILKTFTVSRLWGEKDLSLSFHEDVNFLDPQCNGSGKTTVINLIAAALSADFHTLDRVNFRKNRKYNSLLGEEHAVIEIITRSRQWNSGFPGNHITGLSQTVPPRWKRLLLDDIEGQMHFSEFTSTFAEGRNGEPIPRAWGINDVPHTWLSI